jgi:Uma2 family endonuclease
VPELLRVPMSWEEYLALPERPRVEWVDGTAVFMNAPPLFEHGDAAMQLARIMLPLMPDLYLVPEVYLRLPRNRVRLPDLMLTDHRPPDGWVSDPPLMVTEVLSRATRSEDQIRKSMEYAEAGIGQYWIIDPELRMMDVYVLVDGVWETLAHLDDEQPVADVELAGVTVPLDLRIILRN